MTSVDAVLQELQLIQSSLLPNEHLLFSDESSWWENALSEFSDTLLAPSLPVPTPASFQLLVDRSNIWFDVSIEPTAQGTPVYSVSVKGRDISRNDQEKWQRRVGEGMSETANSEYQIYQVLSLSLLPLLHDEVTGSTDVAKPDLAQQDTSDSSRFHALFTSHHLISPNKRRSLNRWASSLSLSGFAKVGYPGVIYAEGGKVEIEEFVSNVKAMQWLALRLRFSEPLPAEKGRVGDSTSWLEFQKVGEVVEEMRRLGREEYVVEMGIGSSQAS